MSDTPSSLLRRVRDSADAASWREFQELYEPLLLNYVRSRGLAENDARDVVQDVFVLLLPALQKFELDPARGRFRTWLWKVTCNALADWARKQRRQTKAEDAFRERSVGDEPEPQWASAHHQRVLDFVLQRVRAQTQPRTWSCFEQHVLLGRSSGEVADELSMQATAVRVNASRVLAAVRQQCGEYLEELGDA
jgi:RNA polymerase sigma-70 factor (ECF subfamily)